MPDGDERQSHIGSARRPSRKGWRSDPAPDSPKLPDLAQTSRVYYELLSAVFGGGMSPEARERVEAAAKALPPDDQSLSASNLRGLAISHAEWMRKGWIRQGLRARWKALFEEVDVVLCPPMPTVAFSHDHTPQGTRRLDIDGKTVPYIDQGARVGVATLTGFPATTAPIGHAESSLPIGVQIIGGFLDDRTTIAFASLIEREFGGFTPPPNL
jgi:amidase